MILKRLLFFALQKALSFRMKRQQSINRFDTQLKKISVLLVHPHLVFTQKLAFI